MVRINMIGRRATALAWMQRWRHLAAVENFSEGNVERWTRVREIHGEASIAADTRAGVASW